MAQPLYTTVRFTYNDDLGKLISARAESHCLLYRFQGNSIGKGLRRLWQALRLPFQSIWYDKSVLAGADKIVVFDALCTPDYLRWLKKKKPNSQIIVWFWNIAYRTMNPDEISEDWCDKWSFSRLDCIRYRMKFNPLPYFKEFKQPESDKQYDIVFVGRDKGRLEELLKLKALFEDMGLSTKFVISPTHSYDKHPAYSAPITYYDSVLLSASARAVLDYIEVNNSGQSIRIPEAIFHRNKVITNSVLVKDYDFYSPENIFILGVDSIESLPEFISRPYAEIDPEIVMSYDFDNAINRMLDGDCTFSESMLKKCEL